MMNLPTRFRAELVVVVLLTAGLANGQTPSPSPSQTSIHVAAPGPVLREIDDAPLRHRWLLERDLSHPGGPGRLVLAAWNAPRAISSAASTSTPPSVPPVIRLGDRLIVEEDSPVAEARLEAVALSAAALGAPLQVRLTIGGRTTRVLALGPGRAGFAPEAVQSQPNSNYEARP